MIRLALIGLALSAVLALAGCGAENDDPGVEQALDRLMESGAAGELDEAALHAVAETGDARLAWYIADLLRFVPGDSDVRQLAAAFGQLTGAGASADGHVPGGTWKSVSDQLIASDLPAPPGYRERKAALFLQVEPGWKPFFADQDSEIDWRLITWGGVLIDDRPAGNTRPCPQGCIPALDDPELTPASEGGWYPDDQIVFGVVVSGKAVALPKNIMEVHEMVNMTIAGRRIGIPYCTLCGSAQAYVLDRVPEGVSTPVLRTSGLLSRSNKLMYDLVSRSAIDTFTGRALSGPLQDAEVELKQITVVASTWGEWRRDHPETMIVAEDGGIGRVYPADPLAGRDDAGPIFPVGDVDPRLPVQENVVGVIAPNGRPVAFPAEQARATAREGSRVALEGVELVPDGGGFRALARGGEELAAHQAFWFAWSQFHPRTKLWMPPPRGE